MQRPWPPLTAAVLWATLTDTPPPRRLELVKAAPRYHSWPLAARLLEAAAEVRWHDDGEGVLACRLALAIAERLPPDRYPETLCRDLRARALGGVADALRLDGRIDAAATTLKRAWKALERGSGDPLEGRPQTLHPVAEGGILRRRD